MTSAVGMPPSVAQQGQADGLEMKSVREDKEPFFGGMKDVEMHTFKWQEKLFSQVRKAFKPSFVCVSCYSTTYCVIVLLCS